MTFRNCIELIKADYKRCTVHGQNKWRYLLKLIGNESFMITFWFRIASFLHHKNNIFAKLLLFPVKVILKCNSILTGIQLLVGTDIGEGLKFFHYGSVVIAGSVKIGKNVSIHQGVTLGRVFAGKKAGVPIIGDNVVIFAGAKVIGNIHVGNNVVIGANAVVVNDVPDNAVVAGVPAKIVSMDSAKCFDQYWGEVFGRYESD